MRNKICAACNSINGERATYCRKCNASLEGAVIKEVEVQVIKEQPKAPPKPAPRPAQRVAPRATPVRHEDIILPKRPAKPDVIYWPFVVSLVAMFLMLALVFTFVITAGKSDEPSAPAPVSGGTTAATTVAAETTEEPVSDISEITIGDIADQMYTGDFITIPFSLTYNGVTLEEGVDFINEITFCDEAVNRQMNDVDFVSAFYQGALGRPADQAGLDYNVGLLEGGMSRTDLANAILNTPGGEFENICVSLGITPV